MWRRRLRSPRGALQLALLLTLVASLCAVPTPGTEAVAPPSASASAPLLPASLVGPELVLNAGYSASPATWNGPADLTWPLLGGPPALGRVAAQDIGDQATLETRQPEVQWSRAGATEWQSVPNRETVRAGDRVRTGAGAAARLVYFEGTVTEIGPETGILVQRLEQSPGGNIVTNLFQSVGTTVSRVVQLVDPSASFEVETPAATAFVRGTTPRVVVERDGRTRVENIPDGTGGLVNVRGNDPDSSIVVLLPGQQTVVAPGLAPSAPGPIGAGAEQQQEQQALQQQQAQREQRRQQQQALAQAQVAQAQAGLAVIQQQLGQLTQQENRIAQELLVQLNTPTPTPLAVAQVLATLAPTVVGTVTPGPPPPPCASVVGQVCTASLQPAPGASVAGTATGTVSATGQTWQVTISGLPAGAVALAVFQTAAGLQAVTCLPAGPTGAATCHGSIPGVALLNSQALIAVGTRVVAQGRVVGPGVPTATPTATPATATPTPTRVPRAYVGNFGSNSVSVVDTASNAVAATVGVGGNPSGVAASPSGSRVYVANRGSNSVSVLDTATNAVVATVAVGAGPERIAVNAAGTRVYVTNFSGNTVSVLDAASNVVVATVPVGTSPEGVAVNPAGTRVYVAEFGTNALSVLDATTNAVIATVPVGAGPHGVAVTPDGTRVYVTNFGSDSLSIVNAATNSVIATVSVGTGPEGVAILPAGTRVYVANSTAGTMTVLDAATNAAIATVPVGTGPVEVAVHPTGSRVYVTNFFSNSVSVVDTATNAVVATVAVGTGPVGVALAR